MLVPTYLCVLSTAHIVAIAQGTSVISWSLNSLLRRLQFSCHTTAKALLKCNVSTITSAIRKHVIFYAAISNESSNILPNMLSERSLYTKQPDWKLPHPLQYFKTNFHRACQIRHQEQTFINKPAQYEISCRCIVQYFQIRSQTPQLTHQQKGTFM